jgi:hypothetical protein
VDDQLMVQCLGYSVGQGCLGNPHKARARAAVLGAFARPADIRGKSGLTMTLDGQKMVFGILSECCECPPAWLRDRSLCGPGPGPVSSCTCSRDKRRQESAWLMLDAADSTAQPGSAVGALLHGGSVTVVLALALVCAGAGAGAGAGLCCVLVLVLLLKQACSCPLAIYQAERVRLVNAAYVQSDVELLDRKSLRVITEAQQEPAWPACLA